MHYEDGQYYLLEHRLGKIDTEALRQIKLLIDPECINCEELSKCSGIDINNTKQLLQYFVNHCWAPDLLLKVKGIEPEDGSRLRITFCARQLIKVKDDDVEKIMPYKHGFSSYMAGNPLTHKDGSPHEVRNSTLVLTKLIEPHKIDLIGYVMCLLDECKARVVIELCKYYGGLIQKRAIDQTQEMQQIKDIITVLINTTEMIDLPLDELIQANLCPLLSEENFNSLKKLGTTLSEIVHNIRIPVLAVYRDMGLEKKGFERLYMRDDLSKVSDEQLKQYSIKLTKYLSDNEMLKPKYLKSDNQINDLKRESLHSYLIERIRDIVGLYRQISFGCFADRVSIYKLECILIFTPHDEFKQEICQESSPNCGSKLHDCIFAKALSLYINSPLTKPIICRNGAVDPYYLEES